MEATLTKSNFSLPNFSQTRSTYVKSRYSETTFRERFYPISRLKKYKLKSEIMFILQYEDGEFLLTNDFLNLYANGATIKEATDLIAERVEDLYKDLNSGDKYAARFFPIKSYLNEIIIDAKR